MFDPVKRELYDPSVKEMSNLMQSLILSTTSWLIQSENIVDPIDTVVVNPVRDGVVDPVVNVANNAVIDPLRRDVYNPVKRELIDPVQNNVYNPVKREVFDL